jgi:hypothetical protein
VAHPPCTIRIVTDEIEAEDFVSGMDGMERFEQHDAIDTGAVYSPGGAR